VCGQSSEAHEIRHRKVSPGHGDGSTALASVAKYAAPALWSVTFHFLMRPRFEPDSEPVVAPAPPPVLIDPEAFDASEQQFAASLEPARGKFVVETAEKEADLTSIERADCPAEVPADRTSAHPVQHDIPAEPDSDSWRQELSARLSHYRARKRPRAPRYPSLRLKFDDCERTRNAPPADSQTPVTRQSVAVERVPADPAVDPTVPNSAYSQPAAALRTIESENTEQSCQPQVIQESIVDKAIEKKVIEFPRWAAAPLPVEELAEPVFDLPRILEAPEVAPPGPALGGILIDSPEEAPVEKRPGFEIPLQPAPMARRLAATAVDATIVIAAFAGFAYLFFNITTCMPPLLPAASVAMLVTGILWTIYQYFMLVGSGTTPGLKLARLQLNRFDGSPVPRSLRRWRVLTSVISGVSLGLGYAWCFFDEDQLCWHDRITRTYMAPQR